MKIYLKYDLILRVWAENSYWFASQKIKMFYHVKINGGL